MSISYQSSCGQIFICDFKGYIPNEIVKKRPVIAISAPTYHLRGAKICHVVPLSTTEPSPIREFHYKLDNLKIPGFPSETAWVKSDLIYTVSYDRLTAPYFGKNPNGSRRYVTLKVSKDDLDKIRSCVLKALQYDLKNYYFSI